MLKRNSSGDSAFIIPKLKTFMFFKVLNTFATLFKKSSTVGHVCNFFN